MLKLHHGAHAPFTPKLIALSAALLCHQAIAALTPLNAEGAVALVHSDHSDVTWTQDANLLGTLMVEQGYDKVVNAILAAAPTVNEYTGLYTLTTADFSASTPGMVSWYGSRSFANYLNHIAYGGITTWQVPSVVNPWYESTVVQRNGTASGGEYGELFYKELNGLQNKGMPQTPTFINERSEQYWTASENFSNLSYSFAFQTGNGLYDYQYYKKRMAFTWAISPGRPDPLITPTAEVPEPEGIALTLSGLMVLGALARRRGLITPN